MDDLSSPESLRYLRRKLYHALKSKGVFQELKTNLRQKLIVELTSQTKQNKNDPLTTTNAEDNTLSLSLCIDFLQTHGYSYSLSVLIPEANSENRKFYSRNELINLLRLSKADQYKWSGIELNENESLISHIASYMQRAVPLSTENVSVQTDQQSVSFLFPSQTSQLYDRNPFERRLDPQDVVNDFDVKLNALRGEIEGEICYEYNRKLQHFQDNRINELRRDLEQVADAKLKERQVQLELTYSAQKAALEEKERQLREALARDREANERNAFFQRQTLVAEIEAARAQAEKSRQLELDLERQRKELQNEFFRRRAQLSEEEQKLASRRQEFDDLVRQEVERLRKNDEIELIGRKKDIEVAESRIKVEKAALDAQKKGVLALQEEINEKATLFSQMEMLDYQTLKSKLDTSKKEASVLKESLAEALKEIEKLKQGAALATSERSLLTATRQDNDRLRTALEQERVCSNQERTKLNLRIEELKAERSRLEERVCLQENELSRLRGRLTERRHNFPSTDTQRSDIALAVSPTGDIIGKLAPTNHINEALAQPSATVQTAQERLRALEKESVELEATLGRWKEEIFAPSTTKSTLGPPLDVSRAGPLPTNSLSKVFLTNMRTASSIPSLRQFPPSWPLPYTRSMNSLIEGALSGTTDMVINPMESIPLVRFSKNALSTNRIAKTLSNIERTKICNAETENKSNNPEATPNAHKSQNISEEKSSKEYSKVEDFTCKEIQPQSTAEQVIGDKPANEKKSSNSEDSFSKLQSAIQSKSAETVISVNGLAKRASHTAEAHGLSPDEATQIEPDPNLQDEDSHNATPSNRSNEESSYATSEDNQSQQEEVAETSALTEMQNLEGASKSSAEVGEEQEEEDTPASESSSVAGIDPMIRKYMRVLKEKYAQEEHDRNEGESPSQMKDSNPKHSFVYSNSSDSESSQKEGESRKHSKANEDDEQGNSEDFW